MREITGHQVNGCNESLKIEVLDEPGEGGACHKYYISTPDLLVACPIEFQDGPVSRQANGLTHEALIAIVIDRLEGFQRGPFACLENAAALHHLHAAQMALHERMRARLARGVEGTHEQ